MDSRLLPVLSMIEERLGYSFRDTTLLLTACAHASYVHENRETVKEDNERLEFLGDAILEAAISEMLCERYPEAREKKLSRFREQLVCGETLSRIARRTGLGDGLLLGNGVEKNARLLANLMEALIAAVYLDAGEGGKQALEKVILPFFEAELPGLSEGGDSKSLLQQLVEQDGNERLDYRVAAVEGPAHERIYTVEAYLNSNVIGKGSGRSKQEAEQIAAREALSFFGGGHTEKPHG